MNPHQVLYYVRLEPADRRYWHWWLARRDRLDVFHDGRWYALVAWKELICSARPYPVEVTLTVRADESDAGLFERGTGVPALVSSALARDPYRDEELPAVALGVLGGVEQEPVNVGGKLLAADEARFEELVDIGLAQLVDGPSHLRPDQLH